MTEKRLGFMPDHLVFALQDRGASSEEIRGALEKLIEHDPLRFKMGFGPSASVEFDAQALRQ